jgi:hypothetical protein
MQCCQYNIQQAGGYEEGQYQAYYGRQVFPAVDEIHAGKL